MQKRHLYFLLILTFPMGISAQNSCIAPESQIEMHANNIKARILNSGDLFTDYAFGQFIPNSVGNEPRPSTIFTAGLWIGGVDPAGNLKLAANTYRSLSNNGDYWAGPLNLDGTPSPEYCDVWDMLFRVTYRMLKDFWADETAKNNPATAIANYRDIMGWPGRNNPYFQSIWGFDLPQGRELAPFFDANNDGLYDPLNGDYPVVSLQEAPPFLADQIIWCVYNDVGNNRPHGSGGKALQVEVQQTAWAFDCPDQPELDNSIFTAHKITNRASEVLDSCAVGIWVDFDLGCPEDDFVGCNPALQTFFAYNQDKVDGSLGASCNGAITFADQPPVQSVTFLNKPLEKFVPLLFIQQFIGFDVNGPLPYYNMLTGRWPNGVPLTSGGTGYNPNGGTPVSHVFPGDPSLPNAWSMCTAAAFNGDRRTVASTKFGRVAPGETIELVTAWTHHPYYAAPCNLGSTFEDVAFLHNFYDNDFHLDQPACGVLGAREADSGAFSLSPNPVSGLLNIDYPNLQVSAIRCFNASGQLVLEQLAPPSEKSLVDTQTWQAGFYHVQLLTSKGLFVRKVVVLK